MTENINIISITLIGVLFLFMLNPEIQNMDSQTNRIDHLISQLSWDLIGYDHIIMTLFPKPIGKVSKKLINIGKPATEHLISVLEDKNRGVIANLILCKIWHPRRLETSETPIYEGEEITGFQYSIHKMKWMAYPEITSTLDLGSAKETKVYWCKTVPKKYRVQCY